MSKNGNLNNASKNKEDEFYTQLSDIETELKHYRSQFKGKSVFCNCDDAYESNFFKYFAMNFNALGLKKLTSISYVGSPVAQTQLRLFTESETSKQAFKIEITEVEDFNKDGAVNLLDVEYLLLNNSNAKTLLKGNGDFRSPESLEMLKECDIVVTNPPFSLFREYLSQLVEYNKKFLVISNQNSITYSDLFPLLKNDKLWLGYYSGDMSFKVPEYYEERETRFWIDESGQKWRSMGNICWFTNLETTKRHETLDLFKRYTPDEFPTFDNYDAINVNKVSDIPYDYTGVMAVPITFLAKYNPEQFEILGIMDRQNTSGLRTKKYTQDEVLNANDLNARGVIKTQDGTYKAIYARILIRNRKPENAQ